MFEGCSSEKNGDTEMKTMEGFAGEDIAKRKILRWRYGGDAFLEVTTNMQRRDFGGHHGRAACFSGRFCAFVQGRPGVECGKERNGAFLRRRSCAECVKCE